MKFKWNILGLLFMVAIMLSACNVRTIDEMYCLPKRPEQYLNLQSVVDKAMKDLVYHAPISGENQQPVQMVDLNGDGIDECIVFAKGAGEKPLKVLIFSCIDEEYMLVDTLEGNGTAFEQVQYVRFAADNGTDLVIGRRVADQVVRPVSVYTLIDGQMEQLLNTHYSRFVTTDLDANGKYELLILRPGEDPVGNGVAELFSVHDGVVERSQEVAMSEPPESIKRVMVSRFNDGVNGVYVASDVDGSAIITDIYALLDGVLTNVSLSAETETSVQTLRNYYVYAADIDDDGVLELPSLIPLKTPSGDGKDNQYFIRWYAMNSDGSVVDKVHTYHSFTGGWYVTLSDKIAHNITVLQQGNSYAFSVVEKGGATTKLMTLYVFTGQEREEQAVSDNRFVLHRTESTVYAAHLEVASAAYNISQETMVSAFHLITQDPINIES